jgi:putative pyruvate formate lyase activating enzyme
MLYVQDELGCHNVNLVSPSHFVPQIVAALLEAVPAGLRVPLVYNTNGYDSLDTLSELDGIVDIYLPDLRYASNQVARRLSGTVRYVEHARAAIKEMYRQVDTLHLDEQGVAERGLIVRHLILPGGLAGSEDSLTWLAREISPEVTLSVMSQYFPAYRAIGMPVLSRTITREEHRQVRALLMRLGLENGWVQDPGSDGGYRPDFDRPGHPFVASGPIAEGDR